MNCRVKLQKLTLSIISLLLVFALQFPVQAGDSSATAANVNALEEALKNLPKVGVLGSILTYSIPGRPTVAAIYGYADIEKSVPIGVDHLFQIGSQTKMFTAAALLKLQAQGKLDLEDLVSKYVQGTPHPDKLTIRQLAMHTSGIGDGVIFFDPPGGKRPDFGVSFKNHLFLGKVAGEQFKPGEKWAYNNLGFIILGHIIEVVSEMPLNEYLREKILNPLGMHDTYLGALELYPAHRMAKGYFYQGKQLVETSVPNLSWASSAGDMVSSIADMKKWSVALLNENNAIGISLGDFIEVLSNVDGPGNLTRYGLGIMERRLGGKKLWGHGGFIHGYVSLTLVNPETGAMLHLMMNLENESETILDVAEEVCALALKIAENEL